MKYYLLVDGQPSIPHTEEEVRLMVKTGSISRQALVWKEGLTEWLLIEQVIALDTPFPLSAQGFPLPAGLPAIPPEEKRFPPIPSGSEPSTTPKVSPMIPSASLGTLPQRQSADEYVSKLTAGDVKERRSILIGGFGVLLIVGIVVLWGGSIKHALWLLLILGLLLIHFIKDTASLEKRDFRRYVLIGISIPLAGIAILFLLLLIIKAFQSD